MRIDYLRDAPSPSMAWLQMVTALPEVRVVTAFLTTAACVVAASWLLTRIDVERERLQLRALQLDVDRSTVMAVRARAELTAIARWEALDRRIRALRGSGDSLARRLADLANTLPSQSWLTELSADEDSLSATGRAVTLSGVTEALHDVRGSELVSVHGSRQAHSRIVDFQVSVPVP